MRYEFGWGDSVCVREALLERDGPWFATTLEALWSMGYPEGAGLRELTSLIIPFARDQFCSDYPYVAVTAGAHHGMATILRAFRHEFDTTHVNSTYFSFYPRLIRKEGYSMNTGNVVASDRELMIVDSPSNPEGRHSTLGNTKKVFDQALWDGVYNNDIFTKNKEVNPGTARFFVGSFSKFFGLNGIRLGWVGCKRKTDHDRVVEEIVEDTLGISLPSQLLALRILKGLDIVSFTSRARFKIDSNRSEFQKLERYFGGSPVPNSGMFYLARLDKHSRRLLKRVGVNYIDGEKCGAPGHARFNLAQDNSLTSEMVRAVMTEDLSA